MQLHAKKDSLVTRQFTLIQWGPWPKVNPPYYPNGANRSINMQIYARPQCRKGLPLNEVQSS